jgi:hypothetical protein
MSQISLETKSKLSPEKVILRAEAYFGDEYGLEVTERSDCCIRMEGGGGYVFISLERDGALTDVNLEGREWTFELERFMQNIAY